MPSIRPQDIKSSKATLIDVRKPRAVLASGRMIIDTQWRHPFDAANWAVRFEGHQLVIWCVHGHEVSQAVSGYLRDIGLDARYVDGGFSAMEAFGMKTRALTQGELASVIV